MKLDRKRPDHIFVDAGHTPALLQAARNGAPRYRSSSRPFSLEAALLDIPIERKAGEKDFIRRKRQVRDWKLLWDDPFATNYNMCVSSHPDVGKGRDAVMRMFLRAMDKHMAGVTEVKTKGKLSGPVWHNLYGGFGRDPLRDEPINQDISLIVLDNIWAEMTLPKRERLVDIIYRYAHVPKILLTSSVHPIEFCSDLGVEVQFAFWLGEKVAKKTHTI